jgi:anti-sigma factor RsiW
MTPVAPDPDDLACQEIVEIVTDYLEAALPRGERERFEAHLEQCPFCTEYVEQMRAVGGALGGLEGDTIAPDRRDALLAAFRDWRGS